MTNRDRHGFIAYILFLFIGGMVVNYFWVKSLEETVQQAPSYDYKPDTVLVREVIKLQPIVGNYTNPKEVKVYYNDTSLIEISKIIPDLDNMRIRVARLQDTIDLYKAYLTQFPEASKIIDMTLSPDSLSMTLLPIDGLGIQEKTYPLFLPTFDYRFHKDSLYRVSTNRSLKIPPRHVLYRVQGGISFDFVPMAVSLDALYEYNWRWGLIPFGELNFIPTKPEFSSIRAGIKYDIITGYE